MQLIRCSCFASHFGTLELCNLPHFYCTACAECKKGIMPWLDSRYGDKENYPLREKNLKKAQIEGQEEKIKERLSEQAEDISLFS